VESLRTAGDFAADLATPNRSSSFEQSYSVIS